MMKLYGDVSFHHSTSSFLNANITIPGMIPNSKEENHIFLQTSPTNALTCKRLEAQVSFPTTYPSTHIETKQMPAAMWETSQGKFQKSPKKCDPPYYSLEVWEWVPLWGAPWRCPHDSPSSSRCRQNRRLVFLVPCASPSERRGIKRSAGLPGNNLWAILLMDEILHHLGWLKP